MSDKIKRSRSGQKSTITQMQTKVNNLLSSQIIDKSELTLLLGVLKDRLEKVLKLDNQYVDKLEDEEAFKNDKDSSLYNQILDSQLTYELSIRKVIKEVEDAITPPQTVNTSSSASSGGRSSPVHSAVKLPFITLPLFYGNSSEWTNFWECFEANVGDRNDLKPVEKLQYLKGQCKESASELIRSFKNTEANYQMAVDLLKDTYGNPEKIINDLANKFLNLKSPSYSTDDLQKFRASIENTLRSLEAVQVDVLNSGWILVQVLKNKIPDKVMESIQLKSGKDYPSLQEFRDSLNLVIHSMESSKAQKIQKSSKEEKSSQGKPKRTSYSPRWHREDIGNYSVVTEDSKQAASLENKSKSVQCKFCNKAHMSTNCTDYVTEVDRKKKAETLGYCTRCFLKNHKETDCMTRLRICSKCKQGEHHSYFCTGNKETKTEENNIQIGYSLSDKASPTVLPTAMLTLPSEGGYYRIRALFDSGAQRTFILHQTAKRLGLKPTHTVKLKLSGFRSSSELAEYQVVEIRVKTDKSLVSVAAIVIDDLPHTICAKGIGRVTQELLKEGIELADPRITGDKVNDIEVLIGADNFCKFFKSIKQVNNINLMQTSLGNMIFGPLHGQTQTETTEVDTIVVMKLAVNNKDVLLNDNNESALINKLWDLDSIGIKDEQFSPEERIAHKEFENSICHDGNKYTVRLPWKAEAPELPNNYLLAKGRLNSTVKQLAKTKDHLLFYDKLMKEQEAKDFIEVVKNPSVNENCHYLPHMPVVRDSLTTPLRIVFDCSAKLSNKHASLNDCLLTGPTLTEELGKTLLKFRVDPYVCTADISKAFLRIGLHEDDRDFTRFIWLSDPADANSKLVTYRFKSVLFGATSSPFLLQATIKNHLQKYKDNNTAEFLKSNFYVDNLQGSTSTEEELTQIYYEANTIMEAADMPLQEWVSNSAKLNEVFKQDNKFTKSTVNEIKVLGLSWNFEEDQIGLKKVDYLSSEQLTKRSLLSEISKFFDPLGYVSPVTIRGKMLMQEVHKSKIHWDDKVPEFIAKGWEVISKELHELHKFKLDRQSCSSTNTYDLHIFCDASQKAYGAVAYLVNESGKSTLIMSKARVAPLKKKSIPQLELTALCIGARLSQYINFLYIRKLI